MTALPPQQTVPLLMDAKALRQRIDKVYSAMQTRAKPKLFKAGKRKGEIRVKGIDTLPFTKQQLWEHILRQLGPGVVACPYCVEIGRAPSLISLATCVLDHVVPITHGGTWLLDNLRCVCADCNNEKGKLSYAFFIGIMAAAEKWTAGGDATTAKRDRAAFHACLRTHGVSMRMKFGLKKPDGLPAPAAQNATLALVEDF
jgi:5-methylcytosine-specific restriction endonuclease McrA